MARQMKDSGIEWIGEIPAEWAVSRVKYVSDFEPGCNRDGLSDESVITYTPMDCIKNGWFINNTATLGSVSSSLTAYQNGDIVMAKVTPCFENGNIAIMENLASGYGLGSSELFVFRPVDIDTRYFFYWLRNPMFVQLACSTMTGTGGLKRVSPYFAKNCYIHQPPLAEQHRIAAFLDRKCAEIDAVIERTRATIEEYKRLKQAVITEVVTKGVRGPRPMKDSGIEWIGEIPEGWEVVKATRLIISTQNGLTRRDLDKSDGHIVLKLKNITASGQLDYSEINRIQLTDKELEAYQLSDGDFLFVRVNGSKNLVGKCAIYHDTSEPVAYNDHIIRVRLNDWCDRRYFQWFLLSDCGKVEIDLHTSTAAGQFTISGDGLRDLHVVLPSLSEQIEIVEHLHARSAALDALIAKKTALLTELETYKKSLIYEYVTGKKEVL